MGTEPSVPMARSGEQTTKSPARAGRPDVRDRIFSAMVRGVMTPKYRESEAGKKES